MAFKDAETRRAYFRVYNKEWYQRHKDRLQEKRKQHNAELKNWLMHYKSKLCCMQCGENHPACLQFHHRDRKTKQFTVSQMIGRWKYMTIKKLEEEISKCDVLCGNCHAILHWRETHHFDDWSEVLPTVD